MALSLGILGGGQLALMTAEAARRLGVKVRIISPDPQAPAAAAAPVTVADYRDAEALDLLLREVDVVTVETENLPYESLAYAVTRRPLRPSLAAVAAFRDRLSERAFLQALDIPGTPWYPVAYEGDIRDGLAVLGAPAVLKTRVGGYDGLGQVSVQHADQASAAFAALGEKSCVLEAHIPFVKEFSVIAVRGANGTFAAYDASENTAENRVLRTACVPARLPAAAVAQATGIVRKIAEACSYVGVLAVEFFLLADDSIVVNEVAPRVHNSGHRTLVDGSISQFENHVRAVMGLPLGSTERRVDSEMHNILGDEAADITPLLREPATFVYLYGKAEARPGRKMGHAVRLGA